MYIAVPIAKATTPAVISTNCHAVSSVRAAGGTTFTVQPMSTALRIVPIPGRTRSGIHTASRAKPTMMITVPTAMPVRRLIPLCSTSHGASPMSAAMIEAIPSPQTIRPTTH